MLKDRTVILDEADEGLEILLQNREVYRHLLDNADVILVSATNGKLLNLLKESESVRYLKKRDLRIKIRELAYMKEGKPVKVDINRITYETVKEIVKKEKYNLIFYDDGLGLKDICDFYKVSKDNVAYDEEKEWKDLVIKEGYKYGFTIAVNRAVDVRSEVDNCKVGVFKELNIADLVQIIGRIRNGEGIFI